MNVGNVGQSNIDMLLSNQRPATEAGTSALKKAMESEQQSAAALVQELTPPPTNTANLDPERRVGVKLDVTA
ncbi:YjfB family protein [Plasticicumulans acidivorans]|uniref:Putative motility protein YjfB-like n=1 Tax=Plasticicumulans acidivorans TaxID=886464 RepID=A0A317MX70_9GAMM|nr:YjfB family protein [Plasticicumulans acidivorans]PWV62428.1 putative motility protein YjfB-like [Plasticicumulans acidivorans]